MNGFNYLEKFNAREWVEIAWRTGFKCIVVTTKHHEGFHMWDTAFSEFKITKTPFGCDHLLLGQVEVWGKQQ